MQFTDGEDLKQTVLNAPIGICILNAQTLKAEIVNDKFLAVTGKPDEAISESALNDVVQTGIAYQAHEVELTFVYTPVKNYNGDVIKVAVWVLGNTQPVTGRQKVEAARTAMKQERDWLKDFFMQAPAGICILSGPELIYELVNPIYQALLPGRELLNRPIFEALPELSGTPLEQILLNVYRTGEPHEIRELLIPVASFEGGPTIHRYFTSNYIARRDAENQIDGIIAFVYEVTEAVRTQQDQYSLNEQLAATNEESAAANEELSASNEQLLLTQKELKEQTSEKQSAIEQLQHANEELITTQQRLEVTLKEVEVSQERFRSMIQSSPVAMLVTRGDDMIFEEINEAMLRMIGKDASVKGKPWFEAIPELVGQPAINNLYHTYRTGEEHQILEEPIVLQIKGQPYHGYYNITYTPFVEDGQITGVMQSVIDVTPQITARKEVEKLNAELAAINEELRSANEQLTLSGEQQMATNQELMTAYEQIRLSKEAAELGTFDMDMLTGHLEWDARCRQLFGISHRNKVDFEEDFLARLHPDDLQRVRAVLADTFNKSVSNGSYDVAYRTIGVDDQQLRWVRAKGQVYFGKDDEPLRFIGSVIDITEQKQDEQRKNDFIGMVSHELKTPLTSLTAILQVLKMKLANDRDLFVPAAVDKANVQVKKMSSMINGFLNISRLESAKIAIDKHLFDLEDLIIDVIEEMKITTGSHIIEFSKSGSGVISADRDKIASVITNLLSNAIKYSPKGKTIHVNCKQVGNHLQVSIRDEGLGIPKEDLGNVFDRYFRVVKENTQHISGFGIGLYLSAEIVQRHDGRIWVDSEIGVGSTFYFELPLQ